MLQWMLDAAEDAGIYSGRWTLRVRCKERWKLQRTPQRYRPLKRTLQRWRPLKRMLDRTLQVRQEAGRPLVSAPHAGRCSSPWMLDPDSTLLRSYPDVDVDKFSCMGMVSCSCRSRALSEPLTQRRAFGHTVSSLAACLSQKQFQVDILIRGKKRNVVGN